MKRSEIRLELLQGCAVLFAEQKRIADGGSALDVVARQEARHALAQAARDFVAAEAEEKAEEARQAAKAERAKAPRKPRAPKPPKQTELAGVESEGDDPYNTSITGQKLGQPDADLNGIADLDDA